MAKCIHCGQEYLDERKEAGYDYCMADPCVKIGLNTFEIEFRKEYVPALLHKSNYFWIKKSELKTLNVRADLENQV
jgi:hypothetical protein